MLNITFVKFLQLSVSVPSTCVPGSLCLDVLHFCSVDVTSNLSHRLLHFIMLLYCSYFITVYNYISLISYLFWLFFTGRRTEEDEEEFFILWPVFHTKHTYSIPFQTTQNNTNINYTIQQWTDTMFCLSINTSATNLIDSMALLQRYFNTCLYNTMSAILKIFCPTKLWKYSVTWKKLSECYNMFSLLKS